MIAHLETRHLPALKRFFEDVDKDWNQGFTFNPRLTLVYEKDGEILAFITAWDCGQPYAWIDNFLVREDIDPRIPLHLGQTMLELLKFCGVSTVRGVISNPKLEAALLKLGWTVKGTYTIMETTNG